MSPVRTSDMILLVVETETGDAAEELALRLTVQRTLGVDDQGSPWHLERLFRATGPETTDLDRYFLVRDSVDTPSHRFEQAAFELAYRLSNATGFHVEPDLPSSCFSPPEPDFAEASEADVHLPGSESRDWALDAIRCREAWQLPPKPGGTSQGESISIAHPDTGYTDHRDARADTLDLRRDRDFLANDDDALDPSQGICTQAFYAWAGFIRSLCIFEKIRLLGGPCQVLLKRVSPRARLRSAIEK